MPATDTKVIPLEAAVVHRTRRMFAEQGGFIFKTNGSGLPDLIGCYRGVYVGIECKRPDPRKRHPVSPLQKRKLEMIREAGGLGIVVRNPTIELQPWLDLIDAYGPTALQGVEQPEIC
jgi:hypothetical protein